MIEHPASIEQLQAIVTAHSKLRIRGAGTKSAPQTVNGTAIINMTSLRGIIEYDSFEYTFTAYAGTPVAEVQAALTENGQYLPCDPLLVEAGATLGGTIASNTAGSRRYRYGGIRDFILGATVVDGKSQVLHVGGKVVKNAAGFDLAKFYVGSMGQYGVLAEVTFKVFPEPKLFTTTALSYTTINDAMQAVYYLTRQPFDIDIIDLEPHVGGYRLLVRFGGRADSLRQRVENFTNLMARETSPLDVEQLEDEQVYWASINRCDWTNVKTHLIKVPIAPRQVVALDASLPADAIRRYTVAANIAWLASDDLDALRAAINDVELRGLYLQGEAAGTVIGQPQGQTLAQRVKNVLDPDNKFS